MQTNIQISKKPEGGFLQVHTMQEGRLRQRFTDSQTDTLTAVYNAILEAARVMNIKVSTVDATATAQDVVKFILDDYKLAWFDDVLKAVHWGGFGKLSGNNELTTISARNIVQWYEKLRKDYPHELKHPMLPAPKIEAVIITPAEKISLAIQGFIIFVNGSNAIQNERALFYYDSLKEKGLFIEPTKDQKLAQYRKLVDEVIEGRLTNWLLDREKRQALKNYRFLMEENEGKHLETYPPKWDNLLHQFAVLRCKEFFILQFIKGSDKEKLINDFKQFYK